MSQLIFLNGKVRKRALPAFELPLAPDAPTVKRLLLPQGELAQFYDADEAIRYLAFIELRAETVRGNHYHKVKEEWVYLIAGEAALIVEDIQAKKRESVPLKQGDLAVITTGVAHAIKVEKAGQAVEFSSARFDPLDTHKYPLA
jgi:mannose-6-phosphate isomerase-like protein (cupin superfamily)